MDNNNINFQPVFDFIEKSNSQLKVELKQYIDETISAKVDPLVVAVDNMIIETRKYHQEMEAYKHQFQVLKDWAVEVSRKVGVPLPF